MGPAQVAAKSYGTRRTKMKTKKKGTDRGALSPAERGALTRRRAHAVGNGGAHGALLGRLLLAYGCLT